MARCAWTPARKRYVFRLNAAMGVYILSVAAISGWLGFEPPRTGALRYAIAVIPSIPIGVALWVMGRYLAEETDEFMRMIQTQALIGAVGVSLFVVTAWGFLAEYAHVWSLPLFLVFPLFCMAFALVQPFVMRKFR